MYHNEVPQQDAIVQSSIRLVLERLGLEGPTALARALCRLGPELVRAFEIELLIVTRQRQLSGLTSLRLHHDLNRLVQPLLQDNPVPQVAAGIPQPNDALLAAVSAASVPGVHGTDSPTGPVNANNNRTVAAQSRVPGSVRDASLRNQEDPVPPNSATGARAVQTQVPPPDTLSPPFSGPALPPTGPAIAVPPVVPMVAAAHRSGHPPALTPVTRDPAGQSDVPQTSVSTGSNEHAHAEASSGAYVAQVQEAPVPRPRQTCMEDNDPGVDYSAQPDHPTNPGATTPCGRALTTPPSSPVLSKAALSGSQPPSSTHAPAPSVAAPHTFGVGFTTLHQSFAPPTGTAGVSVHTSPDATARGKAKDVPLVRWMTPNALKKYQSLVARRKTDPLPGAPPVGSDLLKRKSYEICKAMIEAREFKIDRLEHYARARGRTPGSDEEDEDTSEDDASPMPPERRKARKDYTQSPKAQPSPRKTRRAPKRNRSPSTPETDTPSRSPKRRPPASRGAPDTESPTPSSDSDREKTDSDQEKSDNSWVRQTRRQAKGKGKAVAEMVTDTDEEERDSDIQFVAPVAPPAAGSSSSKSGTSTDLQTDSDEEESTDEDKKSRRGEPRSGKAKSPPTYSRLPKYWRIAIEIILSICANGPCDPRTVAEKAFLLMLPLERPGEYSRTSGVSNLGPLTPIQQSIYNIARSQDLLLSRQLQLFVDTAAFMEQYRLERLKQHGSEGAATSGEHIAQLQASFGMALPGVVNSNIKPEPLIEQVMQLDKVPEKKQENTLTTLNFLGARLQCLCSILGSTGFMVFLLMSVHTQTLSRIRDLSASAVAALSQLLRGGRPILKPDLLPEDRTLAEAGIFAAHIVLPRILNHFLAGASALYDSPAPSPLRAALHISPTPAENSHKLIHPQPAVSRIEEPEGDEGGDGENKPPLVLGMVSGYGTTRPITALPHWLLGPHYWRLDATRTTDREKKGLGSLFSAVLEDADPAHPPDDAKSNVQLMPAGTYGGALLRSYRDFFVLSAQDPGLAAIMETIETRSPLVGPEPEAPTLQFLKARQVEFEQQRLGRSTLQNTPSASIHPIENTAGESDDDN